MRIASVLSLAALALCGPALASARADEAADRRSYNRAVRAAITESLFGPGRSALIERPGKAVVHFRLDRAGRIVRMRVGKSNRDLVFEQVAMSMVRRAAKSFPPMPASVAGDGADFAIPIDVSILYP